MPTLQDLTKGAIVPDTIELQKLHRQHQIDMMTQGQPAMSFEEFAKSMGVNVLPPAGPLRR